MVTMKNGIFWDVTTCGSLKTDVLQEHSASFIKVTSIGELDTTLAVTSNQRTLRRNNFYIVLNSWTLSWRRNVSPVRYELGFISQKTTFFIVTAVKSSNLT
jgi:hypothetical protein